jgi:hypothetical protein
VPGTQEETHGHLQSLLMWFILKCRNNNPFSNIGTWKWVYKDMIDTTLTSTFRHEEK